MEPGAREPGRSGRFFLVLGDCWGPRPLGADPSHPGWARRPGGGVVGEYVPSRWCVGFARAGLVCRGPAVGPSQGPAKTSVGRSARPSRVFHAAASAGRHHASYSRTTRSAASGRQFSGAGIFAARALSPSYPGTIRR